MFLQNRLHRLIFLVLLGALAVPAAWGGTVGKISGVVSVEGTGLPLGGANITLAGTTMGATAGSDGHYFIVNVPAGTYEVQATLVGYKPIVLDRVQVAPDFTTEVNFSMEQTVLGVVETVEIRAEKPLIQKDLTGSTRFMDRQQIENMPTRGYQDAVGLQAGVATQAVNLAGDEASNTPRLHVRGGRAEEVAYFVDGFSQQDPLTGLSTTSINQNAIDQIVVLTSGFNAEYGKIMSGAVNVITREGAPKYFGAVEAITDNLAGGWIGAKRYDYNIYDLSLGGPVIPGSDQLTFFGSCERRWAADRDPRPIDKLGYTPAQEALFPDGRLPNNQLSGGTWQGKLIWDLTNAVKIRAGTLGSLDNWREYRHAYLFDTIHAPRYEDKNNSVFTTLTHSINPKTFYTVGLSWFHTERFRGDGEYLKDLKGYSRPGGNLTWDPNLPLFYDGPGDTTRGHGGSIWDDYLHRESSYVGAKGDVSFQWRPDNQAKAGIEYRRHTLRRYRHLFPQNVRVDSTGAITAGLEELDRFGYVLDDPLQKLDSGIDGAKHPKDLSIYIQNKYERDDFVLNAGLRFDYLDVATKGLRNEALPLGGDMTTLDPAVDLKATNASKKVSPRLGVGFPVTDRIRFHGNYGIFYQLPNLENLYVDYKFVEHKVKTGGYYYPFGNPNLKPETTTAYEIGFARQLWDEGRIDFTAFYKNVQDLVQVRNIPAQPRAYATFENTDYGTIKGVDVAFDLRRTSNVSTSVSYTLSFANGTGSVANTQHNIAWNALRPPKMTAPLDYDQRHKLSVDVDWRLEKGHGPTIRGAHPFERAGINVVANLSGGSPFTPNKPDFDELNLQASNGQPTGSINSQYGPWRYRVDLKADRSFTMGRLDFNAYIWVLNVFNRKNPVNVYTVTGSPDDAGYLSTPQGRATYASEVARETYTLAEHDPSNYDVPRMVRFGLKTSF